MADGGIEMAADGTPIGAINAAPNSDNERVDFAPATFDETTGNVRRIEMAMSPDAVLDASSPDFPAETVELLLPGYADSGKRMKAIELYVTGDKSLVEIAREVGVPDRTVARWAEEGNWLQFNERMVETLRKHEKARIAVRRIKEREAAIEEQIELGHRIARAGKEFVDSAETAGQFKAAAEGAKLGADMIGRALAINESGKVDADAQKDDEPAGRVSLVMNLNGGLPPVRVEKEAIDVRP